MARTVRDTNLETRTARAKLKVRGKPYFRLLEPGLHLGYRRLAGGSGKWVTREYLGRSKYLTDTVGTADDFSDADGVAVLNFAQAQTLARKRMVERTHQAAGVTGPLLVRDCIEEYVTFLATERKSARFARYTVDAFILPAFADREVASLRTEDFDRWRTDLLSAPPRIRTRLGDSQRFRTPDDIEQQQRRRKSTVNRIWTIFRAALNRAWEQGRVSSNSAWTRIRPFKGVDSARVRYLSIDEATRFLNACDPDFRLLARAALETGCRYGELIRLQVRDFNPDSETVSVWQSKSGKARHVVLTEDGAAYFRQITTGRAGEDFMLVKDDGSPWQRSHQAAPMRAASDRAKLVPSANFHALRHTWASHATMSGVPLMVVAKNLGHADCRMCERHYAHLADSFVKDSIRAGAPRFGSTTTGNVVRIERG
ncbi:MAG: site-specific integrase [Afipia sp.]|nr:site-specific integrase [Afipia sp.]